MVLFFQDKSTGTKILNSASNCLPYFVVVVLAGFLFSCSDEKEHRVVELVNTLDMIREDEPIVLKRKTIDSLFGKERIPNRVLVRTRDGKIMPSQMDDLDLDGEWDELVFQYSFQPLETKIVVLDTLSGTAKLPEFRSRAHSYLGHRPTREGSFVSVDNSIRPKNHEPQSWPYLYQFEGPGWESDKIAYRIYFDRRNGKDIFGKTKKGVFLDSIGLGENYHKLQPWGMDVLKVGSSLGAGSLAMKKNDSLYRLGETESAIFQKIADGPVRAIIKLVYRGWKVADNSFDVVETITIWGGKRWYHEEVSLNSAVTDTLVTGMVNMFDNAVSEQKTLDKSFAILASHGKQSENKDMLGMAILVPNKGFSGYGSTSDKGKGIIQTNYVQLTSGTGIYPFYFYTGWELEEKRFTKQDFFMSKVESEAIKLAEPIQITIK